jgi:predicted metal-dependent hydrolase
MVEAWLDRTPIGERQAQDIAEIVVGMLPNFDGIKPNVVFINHDCKTRWGYCYSSGKLAGKIGLPHQGQNWGVLAHEISHLAEGSDGHDARWFNTCIEVRKLLADMARSAGGFTY